MARGTVKWFNAGKGFGFITPDDGSGDVFIHANNANGVVLVDGLRVEYETTQGRKGPQASIMRKL